jgi:hypothetical protein
VRSAGCFVALIGEGQMLLFEFFPAFVMVVGLGAGVWLYILDRRDRRGPGND